MRAAPPKDPGSLATLKDPGSATPGTAERPSVEKTRGREDPVGKTLGREDPVGKTVGKQPKDPGSGKGAEASPAWRLLSREPDEVVCRERVAVVGGQDARWGAVVVFDEFAELADCVLKFGVVTQGVIVTLVPDHAD